MPVAERLASPGALVELLQHAHEHADDHHKRCDFHDSPPLPGAPVARVNPEGEMWQWREELRAIALRCGEA